MTCGEGHNNIAKSLEEKFRALGHSAETVQIFRSNERKLKAANDAYLFAVKYFPNIYNAAWNMGRKKKIKGRYNNLVQRDVKPYTEDMLAAIEEYRPDAIVCTHFYASTIISNLIKDGKISGNIKTYSILTDYCVHPYWESSVHIDYVFTPTPGVAPELYRRGFTPEQLLCLGFPVNEKFSKPVDKTAARKTLDIPKDKFVATAIAGGNGIGLLPLVRQMSKIERDFILIVVCGRNAEMKEAIEKYVYRRKRKNVICFGFVNNVDIIMGASDVLISRGGACSCTEAMNLNLPLIIREKMIINEDINKKNLIELGCAIGLSKISDIIPVINNLTDNPSELERIKENMRANAMPDAISAIYENIISRYDKEKIK